VRPGPFGGTHPLKVGVASKTIFAFHTPGPAKPARGFRRRSTACGREGVDVAGCFAHPGCSCA
jgi:hypothetical protein